MWLQLGILLISLGASLFLRRRSLVRNQRITNSSRIYEYLFLLTVILSFIFPLGTMRSQFLLWQKSSPASYLIPPYQDISYFLNYSFYVFFAKPIIALLAALIFLGLAKFFNKKFQERFFEPEEPYFGALSIFLVGYPGFWLYLILILISGLIGTLLTRRRFSVYYLWFPVAICVILMGKWLQLLPFWQILKL